MRNSRCHIGVLSKSSLCRKCGSMQRLRTLVAAAVAMVVAGTVAFGETGLPVPRFVSIRSGKVNVRTGPGVRYPIDWVFVRKDMPVEILGEYENWRQIRDWKGTSGWVHQSMLSGRRTVVISGEILELRRKASPDARVVARSEPGVVGSLLSCDDDWCEVQITEYRGWVERGKLWGVYPEEEVE